MRKIFSILIVFTSVFHSCGQEYKFTSPLGSKDLNVPSSQFDTDSHSILNDSEQQYVHSRYEYTDSQGSLLIIENSYPKGGLKYTDPLDIEHVYAVFWTRVTNETDNPFELEMEFSEDSYELKSSPGRLFKLFIPSEPMTSEKESLFNYGFDLKKYLDDNFNNQNEFTRTIKSGDSSGFYVVTLFNKGVDGTLRTGLSIKNRNLIYRVNGKEIYCGNINLNNLKLKK